MDEVRLINATPLEKEMREYALYIGRETTNECESTAECCADMVSEAPTINPETLRPVAHWEVGGVNPVNGVVGNWKCSLCNKTSLKDSPFCPNCGAKMEE
jgi:hypothetical protein|nr:MAG TPA: RNA-binding protein [Caudoviricetes sp.]